MKKKKTEKKIDPIYYIVMSQLEQNERCRNDDHYLICKVWIQLHPKRIFTVVDNEVKKVAFTAEDIVSSFESMNTITRARRKIQNTFLLYPPTIPSVAKHRRMSEENYREAHRVKYSKDAALAIMEICMRAEKQSVEIVRNIKNKIIIERNL